MTQSGPRGGRELTLKEHVEFRKAKWGTFEGGREECGTKNQYIDVLSEAEFCVKESTGQIKINWDIIPIFERLRPCEREIYN